MTGPSPEAWRMGLHALHCREDRCGPNGELCPCPCHRGEVMPELSPADELLNDELVRILELIAVLTARVAELDRGAGSTIDRLATLCAELAHGQRVLSDRISMLELDRKGDQG